MPNAISSDESAVKPAEASMTAPVNVSGELNATMSAQQLSDASIERSDATPTSTIPAGSGIDVPASNNQQAAHGSSSSSSKVTGNDTGTEQPASQPTEVEESTVDSSSGTSKDRGLTGQTSDSLAAFVVPQNGVFEEYNAFKAAQIARREAEGSTSGKALGPPIMSPDGGVAVAPGMPAAQPLSDYAAFKASVTNQADQSSQESNEDSTKQVTEDSPVMPAQSTAAAAKIDSGEGSEIPGATVAPTESWGQTSAKGEAIITPTPTPVVLAAGADPDTFSTVPAKSKPSASGSDDLSPAAPNAEISEPSPSAVPTKQAENATTSMTLATPITIDQSKLSSGGSEPSALPQATTAGQLEVNDDTAQSSGSGMAATDVNSATLLGPSVTLPDDSSTSELHATVQQGQSQAADAAENAPIASAQDSQERTAAAADPTSTVADKPAMSQESVVPIGASAAPVNESGVLKSSQDTHNEQSQAAGTMRKSLEEDTPISDPSNAAQVGIPSQEVSNSGIDSNSAAVTSAIPAESNGDSKADLSAPDGQSPAIETSSTISTGPMPPAQELSAFGLPSTNTSQPKIPYPEDTVSVVLDQRQPTAAESITASIAPVQESSNIGSPAGTTDQSSLFSTTISSTLTGTESTPAPLPQAQDISTFASQSPFPDQSIISSTIQPVQNLETATSVEPVAAAQGSSSSVPSFGTLDQPSIFTGTLPSYNTNIESTLPQMPPAQDVSSFGQSAAITESSIIPPINQPLKTLEIATTAAPMAPAQDISSFGVVAASTTPTSALAIPGASQLSTRESTIPAMPPAQDHSTFGTVTQSTAVTPPSMPSIDIAMQSAQSLDTFVVVNQMPSMSPIEL